MPKLKRSDWLRTPYAKSTAKAPDAAIRTLLARYGVTDIQWTEGVGAEGRPAVMLRFILRGKGYKIKLDGLDADAEAAELLLQVKRAVFFQLKALLELAGVFAPPEKVLFAYLETPDGPTMYDAAQPYLEQLRAPNFGQLLLTDKREE